MFPTSSSSDRGDETGNWWVRVNRRFLGASLVKKKTTKKIHFSTRNDGLNFVTDASWSQFSSNEGSPC